jgi:hypothetical protein
MAFRDAGWQSGSFIEPYNQFLVNADGNFLDIAILEWCKLFADKRGMHSWRKIITNQSEFREGLLRFLSVSETEFEKYIDEVKAYRDRFIAHLDDDEMMVVPNLTIVRSSVSYLYDHIRSSEECREFLIDAPPTAAAHYEQHLKTGIKVYDAVLSGM